MVLTPPCRMLQISNIFFFHRKNLLVIVIAVGRPQPPFYQKVFSLYNSFYSPQHSWGVVVVLKQQQSSACKTPLRRPCRHVAFHISAAPSVTSFASREQTRRRPLWGNRFSYPAIDSSGLEGQSMHPLSDKIETDDLHHNRKHPGCRIGDKQHIQRAMAGGRSDKSRKFSFRRYQ